MKIISKMTRYLMIIVTVLILTPTGYAQSLLKAPSERLITLLATNDIHGGVAENRRHTSQIMGGMAFFSGVTQAIRQGLLHQYGPRVGVFVVDGGDQFQGTLVSNYNEGQLMFAAMNLVGYDAAVLGNHDYDFGPIGWLDDKVTPQTKDKNPRGALMRLLGQARFPLLSANTFYRKGSEGCPQTTIRNENRPFADLAAHKVPGQRPGFLTPFTVLKKGGTRVALIGIDNVNTPHTTQYENVRDLCFTNEAAAYLETRRSLEGLADVFVMIVHDGNSNREFSVTNLVKTITAQGPNLLHAVVAGHTHYVNNLEVNGVPIIQSGSGGLLFGRIDLVWDTEKRMLSRTRRFAGIRLFHNACDVQAEPFCKSIHGNVFYEGASVVSDHRIEALVHNEEKRIAPLANRIMGRAEKEIQRNRITESPMSDTLTDTLRKISEADIAILNTGGIRDTFKPGTILYVDLFNVIPFSNHAVILGPASGKDVLNILQETVKTCGNFGSLMQSGLFVTYSRHCAKDSKSVGGIDPSAKVLHVETAAGEVIYDFEKVPTPDPARSFRIATLDYLKSPAENAVESSFPSLSKLPLIKEIGILRELLANEYAAHPRTFSGKIDNRWKNVLTDQIEPMP